MRLTRLAHTNVVSGGIFSWTALEPAEAQFTLGWFDLVTMYRRVSDSQALIPHGEVADLIARQITL